MITSGTMLSAVMTSIRGPARGMHFDRSNGARASAAVRTTRLLATRFVSVMWNSGPTFAERTSNPCTTSHCRPQLRSRTLPPTPR